MKKNLIVSILVGIALIGTGTYLQFKPSKNNNQESKNKPAIRAKTEPDTETETIIQPQATQPATTQTTIDENGCTRTTTTSGDNTSGNSNITSIDCTVSDSSDCSSNADVSNSSDQTATSGSSSSGQSGSVHNSNETYIHIQEGHGLASPC